MRKILLVIGLGCGLTGIDATAYAQQCQIPTTRSMQCGSRFSATSGASFAILRDVAGGRACSSTCLDDERCRAWTYVFAERKCYLHQQVDPVVANDCCATGRREF